MLRLSVNQSEEKTEGDASGTWHRVERSSRFQSRALRFPDNADLTKVSAKLENGVLSVDLPKARFISCFSNRVRTISHAVCDPCADSRQGRCHEAHHHPVKTAGRQGRER